MTNYIQTTSYSSDIINLLPEGIEYTHEVFAFFSTTYGLKGVVETFRKCVPRAFIPAGSKAPRLPLFVYQLKNLL